MKRKKNDRPVILIMFSTNPFLCFVVPTRVENSVQQTSYLELFVPYAAFICSHSS